MSTPADLRRQLDEPFALSPDQIEFFRRSGYIKLKQVLSPAVIEHYGPHISRKVFELNTMHLPMEQRNTYQKAFLQVTNLWTKDDLVREFVFGRRLARIASELMGVTGVRLWHDQALYKEPSGGITPWHADQYYWPLSNMNTVTVWIPLQATPIEMGPLAFAEGSQHYIVGRDLEISDESEKKLAEAVAKRYPLKEEPFDLGEVSYHYGWTYHRAGANTSDRPRKVMTIIYMDRYAHVAEPANRNQVLDLEAWLPGRRPGDLADSELNPLLYPA